MNFYVFSLSNIFKLKTAWLPQNVRKKFDYNSSHAVYKFVLLLLSSTQMVETLRVVDLKITSHLFAGQE